MNFVNDGYYPSKDKRTVYRHVCMAVVCLRRHQKQLGSREVLRRSAKSLASHRFLQVFRNAAAALDFDGMLFFLGEPYFSVLTEFSSGANKTNICMSCLFVRLSAVRSGIPFFGQDAPSIYS